MVKKIKNRWLGREKIIILVHTLIFILVAYMAVINMTDPQTAKRSMGYLTVGTTRLTEQPISHLTLHTIQQYLTLAACIIVFIMLLSCENKSKNNQRTVFIMLLILSSISCFLFLYRYGLIGLHFFDNGDMYHSYLNSKYIKELGYEWLYVCTVMAQYEAKNSNPPHIRSLWDFSPMRTDDVLAGGLIEECHNRFTQQSWEEFKSDVEMMRGFHDERRWFRRLGDHGHNAPPLWNFIAYAITSRVEVTYRNMTLVSLLTTLMITVMFFSVIVAFGWKIGLLFIIFHCINFPDNYHLGGGLLRYSFLTYLVIGLSLYKMQRYRLSAFFISLSAMMRIFPTLFIMGILYRYVRNIALKKRNPAERKEFLTASILSLIILFLLSVSFAEGIGNWRGFLTQMNLNAGRWADGRLGFIYNFIHPKSIYRTDPIQDYGPLREKFKSSKLLYLSMENLYIILTAIFIIYIMKAADRMEDLAYMIFFGFSMFFLLFSTVRYYYAIMSALILMWHDAIEKRSSLMFILLLYLIMLGSYILYPHVIYAFIFNTWLTAGITVYIILVLAYYHGVRIIVVGK